MLMSVIMSEFKTMNNGNDPGPVCVCSRITVIKTQLTCYDYYFFLLVLILK